MSKARNLSAFISEAAIDASEIGSNAVTTDKLSDLSVTHAKLHTDMDLTSKTVTFADNHISGNKIHGGVISDFASVGIDDNASSTAITITSGGNAGIGYDNPASKLDVRGELGANGSAATPTAYFVNKQSGATSNSIYIGASTGVDWKIGKNVTGISNNVNFSISDSSNNRRFDIDANGNVGIGTTTPEVKLEVNGSADGSVVFGGRSDGGNGNNRRFNLIAYADGGGANYGGGLKIQTRDSVNVFHDRITVQSNGNVGIGTTNPISLVETSRGNFRKLCHYHISDYRGVCDGSFGGWLLLIPAYIGTGTVTGKKFYGTIIADRGDTGSGNSTNVARVHATTAYNSDLLLAQVDRGGQYFDELAKVTYNGTTYLAIGFGSGGGGPGYGIYIDGYYRGTDSNFLRLVTDLEVTSTTAFGTRTVLFP